MFSSQVQYFGLMKERLKSVFLLLNISEKEIFYLNICIVIKYFKFVSLIVKNLMIKIDEFFVCFYEVSDLFFIYNKCFFSFKISKFEMNKNLISYMFLQYIFLRYKKF